MVYINILVYINIYILYICIYIMQLCLLCRCCAVGFEECSCIFNADIIPWVFVGVSELGWPTLGRYVLNSEDIKGRLGHSGDFGSRTGAAGVRGICPQRKPGLS